MKLAKLLTRSGYKDSFFSLANLRFQKFLVGYELI